MSNGIALAIAVGALIVSLVGLTQERSGRYQIAGADSGLMWRLDTATGHITAYSLNDGRTTPETLYSVFKVADMPE
jgi:hypothetical protein